MTDKAKRKKKKTTEPCIHCINVNANMSQLAIHSLMELLVYKQVITENQMEQIIELSIRQANEDGHHQYEKKSQKLEN